MNKFKSVVVLPFLLTSVSLFSDVVMEVLSWEPRIFVYHNFLTPEECDHLIEQAKPYMERSTVLNNSNSGGSKVDSSRTSEGMFFSPNHGDPVIMDIEKRISLLALIPEENGESIQVLHYIEGAEYRPHFDFFDPKTVGGEAQLKRGGQRAASFLMYLNTPKRGGETVFPKKEIKVKPKKGDAVLFFNVDLAGEEDELTLHGGAPVIKGEKWLATRWFRQHEFE